MLRKVNSLRAVLSLSPREHIALVGAGGKTSLMFALAQELGKKGKRVITSTTTKVYHEQALEAPRAVYIADSRSWMDQLREGLAQGGHVFVGRCVLESGKVDGIHPSVCDELFLGREADYVLVEGDGASGLPVKAPAEHEPLIPASATKVVAVLGLEGVGRPLSAESVFRPEAFKKLTGLQSGEPMTPTVLSKLFLHSEGLFRRTPPSAVRIAFLNKLDLIDRDGEAITLAQEILGDPHREIRRVVLGSIRVGRYSVIERE